MIAKGNLNYKVGTDARDEIGDLSRAFDQMTQSLSTSMTSIDNLNQEITERKRAEEALQESQEFSTSLLENAPHAVVVMNPDTSIKYVNPAWEELNGWTLAEIIGTKAPYPWWPDENKEAFLDGFKEAMKQGRGQAEIIAQKKNGEIYWIDMNWASVMHNRKLKYLLINSIDITERKQAEAALQKSEEKFSKAFQASPDSIAITTQKDGKYIDVNDSFIASNDYTREEVIGKSSTDLGLWVNPEDRDRMLQLLKDQGRIHNEEFTFRIKSGELRTKLFSTEPIIIDDEPCMITVTVDITEQKQAENALRESEEKFSAAFRSSPNSISITTLKDGIFLEVNDSFTRDNGYTREEVIGRSSKNLKIWAKPEERDRILQILREKGQAINEEYSSRTKSGVIRTMLFSAETINIAGELCIIAVTTDISERKRVEKLQNDENHVLTLLGQGAELTELLDAIVRLGEDHDPSIKGSVLLFDSSKELLFQAAAPNLPDSYLKLLENGLPVGPNMGSCGTAAYLKERVIVPEIENSPLFPYEEVVRQAMDNDLLACWSQPIISSNGDLLGTIANYSDKVGEPSPENLEVLEWSARIAAIAIERKRAEEALANEAIWRRILIEQSLDGIVILDENSKVYEANQRFAEMLGYSPEELRELHTWDWDTQWTREELLEMGHNVDAEGLHVETYHRRKDGTFFDVEISINGTVWAGEKLIFCVCRDVTARKQAEEALRESEEKFSAAFRASPDMMTIVNLKDGKYVEVNDSFVNFIGYTREELIGHTNDEFNMWVNGEERDRMTQLLEEQGKMRHEEYQFRTKSGEIRAWLCSADIINIGGEPCMLAVATDITERKKALEALRESEEKFSKAFHASPDSITITTKKDGRYIDVNDGFTQFTGCTREEAIGKNSTELGFWVDPKDRDRMLQLLKKQGRIRNEEFQFRIKSGETRTKLFSTEPISLGNEQCMITITTDITVQKEIEAKLHTQKQLIERILATMPEGVLVIDGNDRIVLANEAFRKIFHLGKKATEGKSLGEIIRRNQLLDLYSAVKKGEKANNALEFRYQVKNLEKIVLCNIIKMDGDRILLTFTDASKEREEEEKLYLTDRLASIGEMAAGLAHELNNPLTGVLALSQLLIDSDISEEYKEDLRCVFSEAKRAANIVKNVLLFARNNNYENGRASANEVIRDVLRLREYEEKVSNIEVVTNLQDNLPEIPIDKFQLQQIFLNIILNAEAAIRDTEKPGTLTVKTERANNHINIVFNDNGCGIKKHTLPRIFDPFFTTKDIGKGTGLGLSICYGIVVKHGGKISVESQANQGATFTIRMPIVT